MANSDIAYGFRPVRHASGAPYNGATRPMYIPSTYGTALFIGDPVLKINTGANAASVTVPGVGECPAGTLPIVGIAAAGAKMSGVITGFAAVDGALNRIYSPANTEGVAFVCDDPTVIFTIQEDSSTSTLAATEAGLNASFVAGTGSTASGCSGYELDSSTAAASASLELLIVALHNAPNNEIGANAEWEVMINLHTQNAPALGI